MQTEWSHENGEAGATTPAATPWTPAPGGHDVSASASDGPLGSADVAPVHGESDDAGSRSVEEEAVAAEEAVAEEELHRSAVDAVDSLLDEVELALARLDDGTYGRCEACGRPIADERLAELPIVRTCEVCDGAESGTTAAVPVEPVTA
jgi:RNA polymerase-binding transcription factor DksA